MGNIVIVGLGAGSFAAVLAARKTDRAVPITIIDDKSYDLMHPCGLPYAVEGIIESFENLKHALHLEKMKVDLRRPFHVDKIDAKKQLVIASGLNAGEKIEVPYEKLLIGTGSRPFVPPIPGLNALMGKGAYTISTPEESEALKCKAVSGMKAVCLGAGAIGLETAVALKRLGLEVTVIEMLENIMPRALDSDMSAILQGHLQGLGIEVLCGRKITQVAGAGFLQSVFVDGEEIAADILVVAAGVRANSELAAEAGVAVGKVGIIVDEKMETSVPNIYAYGDCTQTKSLIDGVDFTLQLSTTAYRHGTIAGINAAGGNTAYPGVSGAFVSKVGNLEVAAVGYTTAFATAAGYKIVFGKLKDMTLFDWYPGADEITVKVVADSATGRILGGQAVGVTGAAWRVNVISAAIHSGMTLDKLSEVELTYCPPISQTYDALTKAVDLAIRKRGG
jgi:NADH oxidase (H2O2-forming)